MINLLKQESRPIIVCAYQPHSAAEEIQSMEGLEKEEKHELVLRVLELLKQASHDLQSNPDLRLSDPIKALLELETESDTILSSDPNLSRLSLHLSSLKSLVERLRHGSGGLRSFLRRRASTHELARVAGHIESEIQAWIDRESLDNLVKTLNSFSPTFESAEDREEEETAFPTFESAEDREEEETALIDLLAQFESRVSQGFNRELQDLVLKSKVFASLEWILCNPNCSHTLRERSASVIESLIRFNKNVFVGQVLMGQTVHALISMSSVSVLRILCSLIRSIKSPLVDEIESNHEIPEIIGLLSSDNLEIRALGLDCVLEIGYFGRKEAIEAMMDAGLVERLVELQRSELGGDLIDVGQCEEEMEEERKPRRKDRRERYLEKHPFASCVARFAVQMEVGEGLRQREKRAFKQEVLKRVREACVSDAEAATIGAEVLWGSSL